MQVSVVPFDAKLHLDETVSALIRVRTADPTYPPPIDVAHDSDAFADWLLNEHVLQRWVALADGKVAGHVAMTNPHDYLLKFLAGSSYAALGADDLCEICKLFVDPLVQRVGIGKQLLSKAMDAAASFDRVPALAVITTSTGARRLYDQIGLQEVGSFTGVHGLNHVFAQEIVSR